MRMRRDLVHCQTDHARDKQAGRTMVLSLPCSDCNKKLYKLDKLDVGEERTPLFKTSGLNFPY